MFESYLRTRMLVVDMSESTKWVRHKTGGEIKWSPLPAHDAKITQAGPKPDFDEMEDFGPVEQSDIDILPPAAPTRVVALAKNRKGVEKEPIIFLKTPSSVIGEGTPIEIPSNRGRTWSEVELAFVIDKKAQNVAPENAPEYIRGYTVANDVTTENIEDRDWHLARGKALDTYCPTGPYLVKDLDTSDLAMRTRVNGDMTLETSTKERLFDEADALAEISSLITLEPGDLILTGAPDSPHDSTIQPGDTTDVEIEGIGTLSNPVIKK